MAHAIRETEKEKQRVKEMMQRRTEGRQVYLEKREVAGREELGLVSLPPAHNHHTINTEHQLSTQIGAQEVRQALASCRAR